MDVITIAWWDYSVSMLVKGAQGNQTAGIILCMCPANERWHYREKASNCTYDETVHETTSLNMFFYNFICKDFWRTWDIIARMFKVIGFMQYIKAS